MCALWKMDSEVRVWLKRRYQDAAVSGPETKRTKFSDIVDDATSSLPTINPCTLSRAIKATFPNSMSKKTGKSRQTYVYGLETSQQPEQSMQEVHW